MICPQCSHENVNTAKFCNECGFRFPDPAAAEETALPEAIYEVVEPEEVAATAGVTAEIEAAYTIVEEEPQPAFETETDEAAAEEPASADEVTEESSEKAAVEASEEHTEEANDFDEANYASLGDIDVSKDVTVPIPVVDPKAEMPPAATTAVLDGLDNILAEEYTAPASKWRTGNTMQFEPVSADSDSNKNKKFSAPEINLKLPKTSRRVGQIVAVVAAVAIVAGFATYQMEFWGGKSVPDVVGMAEADAVFVLEGKGFIAKEMKTKSDDTEGLVLMTDPSAGGRQDLGKEIIIHVATGRIVPEIKGCTKEEALAKLADEGFENVTVKTKKSDEKAGLALEVSPKTGDRGKAGTPITLFVSEPYRVPEVVGKNETEAMKLIKAEKFKVDVVNTYTDEATQDTVLSVSPAPGTALKSGKTVTVEIARSKAQMLVEATYNVVGPGADIRLDGVNYHVDSVDAVRYEGNNVTSYTLTASPFTTLLGERVSLGSRSITGTLTWTDDGKLASADPAFSNL